MMGSIFKWFSDTVVDVVSTTYDNVLKFIWGTPQEPQAPEELKAPEEPKAPEDRQEQVVNRPLRGSSHIPLPNKIKDTKALINIKNKDNQCFKYAVTRALSPVTKNAGLISKELKEQTKKYNWDGIEFPTPCTERQFKNFEKNNNVSLLVLGENHQTNIIPLYTQRSSRDSRSTVFSKE